MAPSSVVMIVVAPFMGRLTDKIGGKYILVSGLSLFAIGMGWAVLTATPTSTWQDFLAPLIVAGAGMGGTFAPLTTVAMRQVDPRMAGAASGMLNTARQVGSVIGTATVGALLENRLVASLTSQATSRSAGLPAQAREQFISGFHQAAATGLLSGGPANSGPAGPRNVPASLAAELHRLAAEVFTNGYVLAMRWTMVLPIAVIALAAVSCLAIKQDGGAARATAQDVEAGQMAGTISSPRSSGQSPGSASGTVS
jgi:MFS family permease